MAAGMQSSATSVNAILTKASVLFLQKKVHEYAAEHNVSHNDGFEWLKKNRNYLTQVAQEMNHMLIRFALKPVPPSASNNEWSLALTCDASQPPMFKTPFEHFIFASALSQLNVIDTATPKRSDAYKPTFLYLWTYKHLRHLFVDSVKSIAKHAFVDAHFMHARLRSVSVLGEACFARCRHLTTVDLSESNLTNIPSLAFYRCVSLSSVRFPTTRKFRRINARAFEQCTSLKQVDFDPIVYVDPKAFDADVVLPTKPDYIPKVQIGERVFPVGTKLFRLEIFKTFDPSRNDISFFAQDIQLCLKATEHKDRYNTKWFLHVFEVQRSLRLVTSPRNFREGLYRLWEDDDEQKYDSFAHIRVEEKLHKLCDAYDYDGWYARVQLDNWNTIGKKKLRRATTLRESKYETAVLKKALLSGVLKQIASVAVKRDQIASATTATVSKNNSVTIKTGRTVLLANQKNELLVRGAPVSGTEDAPGKRRRTKVISANDNISFLFAQLRF